MGADNPYRGHRYPRETISYVVSFYYPFPVSFRDTEEAMAARGVLVSHETVLRWCEKLGHLFAAGSGNIVTRPGSNGNGTRSC